MGLREQLGQAKVCNLWQEPVTRATDEHVGWLQIAVYESPLMGGAQAVEDGLTPAEATALLQVGDANSALRLVHVGPGRIEALLSGAFASAPLAAQIFVVDGTTTFVSNPISVSAVAP